jgi:unsaturated rhamnogalacturonyl hydrolase
LQDYPETAWKWHYEDGLLIKAISSIDDPRFGSISQKWIDHFVNANGEINTYQVEEFNLDQISAGRLLFPIIHKNDDERYIKALRLLQGQLQKQPRNSVGGFWHKLIYPQQMWLDGLYMAEPFYAEYASMYDQPEAFDDITNQFIIMEQHARDPKTGLLYHGWDETRKQKWANPETGCSSQFWGRALGWFVMAIVDVLDYLPMTHPNQKKLVEMLDRLSASLVRYQDPTSGMWYQIVDKPGKEGNYLESSVTAMLVYGFTKSVRKRWLPEEYSSSAFRAYRGLLENMIRMDATNKLSMQNICGVAGLGGEPYRDGSYEYYVNEPIVVNDLKGVGPFILAALEMEKSQPVDRFE